ncbi:peptidoglycan editing factor PgeF [Nitrospirota bacterium]
MIFPEVFDGKVMGFFTDRNSAMDMPALTSRKVYMPRQEHTSDIVDIEDDLDVVSADACFTLRHDIMLGVKTADCVPMLLFDPLHEAMGAVHAGWRGTAMGLASKSIRHMTERYGSDPADILLAIGPAIRWCCYEVQKEVLEQVMTATGEGEYHKIKDGRICLDLQSANRIQAENEGVLPRHISLIEECTFCYPDKFYSYRYDKTDKRQGAFIGMP